MLNLYSIFTESNGTSSENNNYMLSWKAHRITNNNNIESAIFELTECLGRVIIQEDTYFDTVKGLLKLSYNISKVRMILFFFFF